METGTLNSKAELRSPTHRDASEQQPSSPGIDRPPAAKRAPHARLVEHLRWMARYYRPYLWQLGGVTVVATVSSLALVPVPLLVREIIDRALPNKDVHLLVLLVLGILGLHVLGALSSYIESAISTYIAKRIRVDIQTSLYDHLQRMPLSFYSKNHTGKLLTRTMVDVANLNPLLPNNVLGLVKSVVTTLVTVIVLLQISPLLTLVVLGSAPLLIPMYSAFGSRMFHAALSLKHLQEGVIVRIQEDLRGTSLIQSMGIGAARREHAAKAISEVEEANRVVAMKGAASAAAGVLLTMALTLVLWGFGGYRVLSGALSIGTLIAFSAYIGRIDGPVRTLVASNMAMTNSRASVHRLQSLLSEVSTIQSAPDSLPLVVRSGAVGFQDVSFSYDGSADIFRDLNLVFPGGQVSAVVGKTGVGKTSLLSLIPRLYDATRGTVTIDGQCVRQVDLDSLRKSIAVVRQDTFLFNTTIRDNLLLGRQDIAEDFLLETCRNVGIDEDIRQLPKGYDTEVVENGANLSGGQKQRLALVRALLSQAPIILLDEFTSALDSKTERNVHPCLKSAFDGRTVMIITHNAGTLELADRVFRLSRKDGATIADEMGREEGIAFVRETDQQPNTGEGAWGEGRS